METYKRKSYSFELRGDSELSLWSYQPRPAELEMGEPRWLPNWDHLGHNNNQLLINILHEETWRSPWGCFVKWIIELLLGGEHFEWWSLGKQCRKARPAGHVCAYVCARIH